MKLRLTSLALVLALVSVFVLAPFGVPDAKAQTPPANPLRGIPVSFAGTFDTGVSGNFTGTLDITRFSHRGRQLLAHGTLTGVVTQTVGGVTTEVGRLTNFPVTLPVNIAQASCRILTLNLGPIYLNLLGLVVNVPTPITVIIEAVPGPGNLLGNLLCAIARLLDRPNLPPGLATNLLNAVLRQLLGGLGG